MSNWTNCDDFNCKEFLPQYGLAPHSHDINRTGHIIGSTVIKSKDEWPWYFVEDEEEPGMGMWYCPKCGNGVVKPK